MGRVLIVEDDTSVANAVMAVLAPEHELTHFADGPSAAEGIRKDGFDVALIDMCLPGLEGNEVAERLLKTDPSTVRILASALAIEDRDPRLRPFDMVLPKPFGSLDEVRRMVSEAVVIARARRIRLR